MEKKPKEEMLFAGIRINGTVQNMQRVEKDIMLNVCKGVFNFCTPLSLCKLCEVFESIVYIQKGYLLTLWNGSIKFMKFYSLSLHSIEATETFYHTVRQKWKR